MRPRIEPALLCLAAVSCAAGLFDRADLEQQRISAVAAELDPIIRDAFLTEQGVYSLLNR